MGVVQPAREAVSWCQCDIGTRCSTLRRFT
jgi:hypothetical protein